MRQDTQLETVHYIDDSSDEFLITRLLFRRSKLNVTIAAHTDLQSFMQSVKSDETFDPANTLVISDLNLGGSSGLEVLRALRADPGMAAVMAGICSGSDDPADQKAARDAGADFFVTKPLNQDAMESICDAIPGLSLVPQANSELQLHVALGR